MATDATVQAALFANIEKQLASTSTAKEVLRLAEAYAWAASPGQAHGGSNAST